MARCYNPLYLPIINEYVPCGSCVNCQRSKIAQWTFRAECEMFYWSSGCLVTMTYDNDHLPIKDNKYSKEACKNDYTSFFNDLRRYCQYHKRKYKIMCALEFGKRYTQRPHFHLLLLGFTSADKELLYSFWRKCEKFCFDVKDIDFTSDRKKIGAVRYITKYMLKEHDKDNADNASGRSNHYKQFKNLFFVSMGLGKQFFIDNLNSFVSNGFKYRNGKKEIHLPRYYIQLLKRDKQLKTNFLEQQEQQLASVSIFYNDLKNYTEKDCICKVTYTLSNPDYKNMSKKEIIHSFLTELHYKHRLLNFFTDSIDFDESFKDELFEKNKACLFSDLSSIYFGLEKEEKERKTRLYNSRFERYNKYIQEAQYRYYHVNGHDYQLLYHPDCYEMVRTNLIFTALQFDLVNFYSYSDFRNIIEEKRANAKMYLQVHKGNYDEFKLTIKKDVLESLYKQQFISVISYA